MNQPNTTPFFKTISNKRALTVLFVAEIRQFLDGTGVCNIWEDICYDLEVIEITLTIREDVDDFIKEVLPLIKMASPCRIRVIFEDKEI